MERTKHSEEIEPQYMQFDNSQEPLNFNKITWERLLKNKAEFPYLWALYSFYYYTAKWQNTNQPRAVLSYVAQGLGWGESTVKKYRKTLKSMGLIEDVMTRSKDGKSSKWYVKIHYLPQVVAVATSGNENNGLQNTSPVVAPTTSGYGDPRNALDYLKLNSLDYIKESSKEVQKIIGVYMRLIRPDYSTHEKLTQAIVKFITFRVHDKKVKMGTGAIENFVNRIHPFSPDEIIDACNLAIECRWTTVFPEKKKAGVYSNKRFTPKSESTYQNINEIVVDNSTFQTV